MLVSTQNNEIGGDAMNFDYWSVLLVVAVAIVAVMLLDLVKKDWRGWPRYVLAFLCAVVLNLAITVLLVMFRTK